MPFDPVLAELMDLRAAAATGRLKQRLDDLRAALADEKDSVWLGLVEAELIRQLEAINFPAPHKMAAAVLPRRGEGTDRSTTAVGDKPRIDAGDHNLPRVSQLAWDAVEKANAPPVLFLVGGVPSRLEGDQMPTVRELTLDRFRHHVARMAEWYVHAQRGGTRDAEPPITVVRDMLATPAPPLPALRRIVAAPVFAADGRLLRAPGYHADTGIYYAPAAGLRVGQVAERPSGEDLARAKALLLEDLLVDFPFVGEAGRAHAVALFLLPFVRDLVDGPTPLHFFDKPTPRTGASLLVQVLLHPALGHAPATMTAPGNEDEWRKTLVAKLLKAPTAIVIDNVNVRIRSAALASALTESDVEDRMLRTLDTVSMTVRCAWAMTGINAALSTELAGRTVLSRLDAKVERPEDRRGFKHPLPQWGEQHRAELVWAALTLVQAWLAAGRPDGQVVLGRFEAWSRVLGGILDVAQIPGLLGNRRELHALTDVESRAARHVLGAWLRQHGSQYVGVAELVGLSGVDDLPLRYKTDRGLRTALGLWLVDHRDRPYTVTDDAGNDVVLQIVLGDSRQHAGQYRLAASAPDPEKGSRGSPGSPAPENPDTYGGEPQDPPW
ncbi:MAG: hypothetical protein ACREM3_15225 [Candidatus Rokuibacteriota bacterium]